jgi:hypothetical protein
MESRKKNAIASLTLVFHPEYGRLGRTFAGAFHPKGSASGGLAVG